MSSMFDYEEQVNQCMKIFCKAATTQGHFAYLFMSIHAVNPGIFARICSYDPNPIIFANMIYGIGVQIFSRPNMSDMNLLHRVVTSILASLSFNYSTMMVYEWLVRKLSHRPYILTYLGFFCGRFMILNLLAFLYHVDSRVPGTVPRDPDFDSMYV